MKITKKKVTASQNFVQIPSPFDKYYRLASDEEIADYNGCELEDVRPTPCEEAEGYECKNLWYCLAEPKYIDALSNNGLDQVELVVEGNNSTPILAYYAGGRIYPLDMTDIEMAVGFEDELSNDEIESCNSITASEEFDEVEDFFSDDIVSGIAAKLSVPRDIAEIIYSWYEEEGATEDFDSVRDFLDYVQDDIWDMLDACDDETIKEKVANAISASTDITAETDIKAAEEISWMGKYKTIDGQVKKVYFHLGSNDFEEAEEYFNDIIPEAYTSSVLLGRAPSATLLEKDGFTCIDCSTKIEACDITGAVDTGLEYWYYGRHGLGPGTIPQGVTVLDTVEEGWKTWMLLDKLLTTEELRYYDLKEEWPPVGSVTHNGDVIEACDSVMAADQYDDKEYDDGLEEPYEEEFSGDLTVFENKFYGTPIDTDSYDGSIMKGWCTCVGYDDDDEGHYWACFTKDNWEKVKDLPLEEIYRTYGNKIWTADGEWKNVEGATVEELEEAMNKYKGDVDRISKQLDDLQQDVIKKGGLFNKLGKKKRGLFGSEATLVDETDDSLNYVVSSDEVDEDEEDEDFLNQPDQEFDSRETAINGKQGKLPAVFKKASIPQGALVLDYGGGTVESEAVAQNYLDQFEATEMLYDPFNQTPEHNREVVKNLRSNGGADVAVCSNVLNVIKEEEVRLDLLNKIKKLMKPGATAYISVYEGGGKGEGAVTQKGKSYQNNRKLEGYLEEVQQVFPDAKRKGAVIIAPNTSESIASSIDINSISLDALKDELEEGCIEYLTGPEGGFLRPGTAKESRWDMTADEIFAVDVRREDNCIVCEVRAELDYDGMENLKAELDPIVSNYDEDAYFDQVTSGIMEAYLCDNSVYGSTDITADYEADRVDKMRDDWLQPHKELEYPVWKDDLEVVIPFDLFIDIKEDGDWVVEDTSFIEDAIPYDEETGLALDIDKVEEDFAYLLTWHLPEDAGRTYHCSGTATLVYKFDNHTDLDIAICDTASSHIDDLKVENVGYTEEGVESSTELELEEDKLGEDEIEASQKIEGGMTEEELDTAILEGKPFDLEDFKKYKVSTPEEGALQAKDVEIGDTIENTESGEMINLGTVFKVKAINNPETRDDFFDYTFDVEIVGGDLDTQSVNIGDIMQLFYDEDEYVGTLVLE